MHTNKTHKMEPILVATLITFAVSEIMPFLNDVRANGIVHGIFTLARDCGNLKPPESVVVRDV